MYEGDDEGMNTYSHGMVATATGDEGSGNPESIQVLVRVRPLADFEVLNPDLGAETVVDIQSNTSLAIFGADGKRSFQCSFDAVLGPLSSQAEVYHTVRDCTSSVLEGFNSTIFAYGQTGSGKVGL